MSMNDNIKIVIRGVLDRIDEENITENKAVLIGQALSRIFGGSWNVIIYPSYESAAGFTSSYFHWRHRQWVYAEKTTNTTYNANEIRSFMTREFGWSTIRDINAVQQSAYARINNRFSDSWGAFSGTWFWCMESSCCEVKKWI